MILFSSVLLSHYLVIFWQYRFSYWLIHNTHCGFQGSYWRGTCAQHWKAE